VYNIIRKILISVCHYFNDHNRDTPRRSNLILASSLLGRALQSKLYRQDCGDVDRRKCILLHCWIW